MRALNEKIGSSNFKNFKILGVDYEKITICGITYIFNGRGVNSNNTTLKTPNGKQVCDIINPNKITKNGGMTVFKFIFYNDEGSLSEIFVYTTNGNDFLELGNLEVIDKPIETPVQKEVGKRKGLVKRVVDRVIHPKTKK